MLFELTGNPIKNIYAAYTQYIGDELVQAMIDISAEANQIFNIVKAKYNLKTKSEAIARVAIEYGAKMLEPEVKPAYLKKFDSISAEKGIPFKNMAELRKLIEDYKPR